MRYLALSTLVLMLVACGDDDTGAVDVGEDVGADVMSGSAPLGSCSYTNSFSMAEECREYGPLWIEGAATRDCRAWRGELEIGGRCDVPAENLLGSCLIDGDTDRPITIYFPGSDLELCDGTRVGCEVFASGEFTTGLCEDAPPITGGGGGVFVPPTLECAPPLAGEPAGMSDGEVCTVSLISACTEEGRRFDDYGSCDTVRTQRPYYPFDPAEPSAPDDDPRLTDSAYQTELAWVAEQVEACACICCHSEEAPDGPSNWFIESEGIWVDSFEPSGLAFVAGWLDSTSFGAFPPEENNGFNRTDVGLPSTDAPRMLAFFEAELERRGFSRDDFADSVAAGGPLYAQLVYELEACEGDVGIDADGTITWEDGAARYIYVLEEGSANPTVPPNLDLPEGTLWRLDVAPTDDPIETGITYGVVPEGASQRFPEDGAPPALVSGHTYHLYVSKDVLIPIARCTFVAP